MKATPSGLRKVAVLFLALGPSLSAKVLKHFSDEEIERISLEVANTTRVESSEIDAVLDEVILLSDARQHILDGGIDYAREMLNNAVGTQKAAEIIRKLKDTSKVRPFNFVDNVEPKQLVNLISQEHPQTIAMILSHLNATLAAKVLSELPEELRGNIARRIALMERTSPEVLKGVEDVLRQRLSSVMQPEHGASGGIPTIVDILNRVDRSTEKLILEELEQDDAALANEIRQRLFIFEDIITLDNIYIQRVLRELDNDVLALALKGASDEVRMRIFKNMSSRAAEILKENLEDLGPVRLRDVEEAQQKVVSVIRQLDETGEIIISRGGEDAIVV